MISNSPFVLGSSSRKCCDMRWIKIDHQRRWRGWLKSTLTLVRLTPPYPPLPLVRLRLISESFLHKRSSCQSQQVSYMQGRLQRKHLIGFRRYDSQPQPATASPCIPVGWDGQHYIAFGTAMHTLQVERPNMISTHELRDDTTLWGKSRSLSLYIPRFATSLAICYWIHHLISSWILILSADNYSYSQKKWQL